MCIRDSPYVGKLCFFRVYSGTLDAGTTVYNGVDVLTVVGVHLQDTADTLVLILNRVVNSGASLNGTRVHAEEAPVSYTHLDVYKRQEKENPPCRKH